MNTALPPITLRTVGTFILNKVQLTSEKKKHESYVTIIK